ncbi:MAG TPA: VWA domain-containing protein [Steroidobacteraceae bacterium]|jgi:Ca-activated chloride channel family protein|nr:VWA domain-containing protein [Steroidobacteraceae bacterium]
MNRVVRGSSLLIVTAIVAACAAKRDESQPLRDRQDAQAQQRATEGDVSRDKAEARETRAIQEVVVTNSRQSESTQHEAPMAVSAVSANAVAGNVCCAPVYQQPTNTERYQHLDDNPVHLAAEQPVSTFSIDVDTGAYANVRRFLSAGQLPPQDAVRVEEMVNYFDYRYVPPASRDVPFRVATEVAPAPWNPQALLMKIGIKGFEVAAAERPPANLVFLIDVSGSMQSPDKLPLLKNAFRLLTDQLTARDRVSMVVYAGSSGVVLEPTAGDQKHKIREAIDRLEAGGSTNGAAGIERAYQLAHDAQIKGGINRVVLATDGDFNVGVVDFEALVDMAERQRGGGVALTTLGFGTGNYNDQLLERLADAGNGNYAYVDTLNEARKVLVSELSSTLFTIAKDVKIQVEFNPATVLEYRLIGYENRMLAREDFNNDKVDAGDIGAGHRVTALYEIVPVGKQGRLDPLRYGPQARAAAASNELANVKLRYKKPQSDTSELLEYPIGKGSVATLERLSPDFRFAASVAAFGQLLRGGKYVGNYGYGDVERLARGALDDDPEGYRREFLSLVKLADSLTPKDGAAPVKDMVSDIAH